MIAIVDYGRGNLYSIARALETIGAEVVVTETEDGLGAADAVVLPGVGSFGDAMAGLRERNLIAALRASADRGTPLLGICLGMQLLFSRSEEFGAWDGLDLIPGTVRRLPHFRPGEDAVRIPNVGWRGVERHGTCPLWERIPEGAMFYFVHSFVPQPDRAEDVAGTLKVNGTRAAVMVQRANVFGCQFHPEKSGPEGLAMLRNFEALSAGGAGHRRVA